MVAVANFSAERVTQDEAARMAEEELRAVSNELVRTLAAYRQAKASGFLETARALVPYLVTLRKEAAAATLWRDGAHDEARFKNHACTVPGCSNLVRATQPLPCKPCLDGVTGTNLGGDIVSRFLALVSRTSAPAGGRGSSAPAGPEGRSLPPVPTTPGGSL